MKAVLISKSCRADELTVSEIPIPEVKSGWVLVRVRAAGLNHSEALLRGREIEEDYIHKPIVPGIECVGEVADPSYTSFRIGERVVCLMGGMGRSFNGSYAEYALLPQHNVFKVTIPLDWVSLAAVPETYFTAYGSLKECLLLCNDDVLLVRWATSTVGQAAIQLGKAMGATVVAACRRETSFPLLKSIGADACVIDDGAISKRELPFKPNKVLELIGPKTLQDSLNAVVGRPGYVCCTGVLGNVFYVSHFEPIRYIPNGVFLSSFYSNYPTQEVMDEIFALMHLHQLRPLYAKVFPLDHIADAHTLLDQGGAGGKIVLTM